MNLGRTLKEVRVRKGRRQNEVADTIGISAPYLSQVEAGKQEPSWDLIKSLCKLYGLPPAILMWMAMEAKDVKKNKQAAFETLRGPMSNLISEFFL